MRAQTYTHMHIHRNTGTLKYTHSHTQSPTHSPTHIYPYKWTHSHTHLYTITHSHILTHSLSPSHTYICACSEKARFHEPTNHDDERNETADEWRLTKTIGQCEEIKTVADECLRSFHCTVLTDYSLADQHYLTCLIF